MAFYATMSVDTSEGILSRRHEAPEKRGVRHCRRFFSFLAILVCRVSEFGGISNIVFVNSFGKLDVWDHFLMLECF